MRLFLFVILLISAQNHAEANNPQRKPDNDPCNDSQTAVAEIQSACRSIEAATGQNQQQAPKPEVKPFMTHGEIVISAITGAYVVIAFFTLLAIHKQASVAQLAASAATDAEGGIVSVYAAEFYLGSDQQKTAVSFRMHNLGRTIATSFANERLLQTGDSADTPPMPSLFDASDNASRTPDFIIPPDKDSPKTGAQEGAACTTYLSTIKEPMMGTGDSKKPFHFVGLTETEYKEITAGKKFLWSYGFVRYRDIFKRRFELRFCYRFEPKLRPHGGFLEAGPSEFNRLTLISTPQRRSWRKVVDWYSTQIEAIKSGESEND